MLSLQSVTAEKWLAQVDGGLDEVLIDHAHCEHKAAATAMSLFGNYIDNRDLCQEMRVIIDEELDHFQQVLELLDRRGIPFRRLPPGHYGKELRKLIRPHEPSRAVDRLLISGLIEARSCERFSLLADHMSDRDSELANFYRSLFESEARHHSTYVRLAKCFASDSLVKERLKELSQAEAEIIGRGNELPRMHS